VRNKQILEMMKEIKMSKQTATIKNWRVEKWPFGKSYVLTGTVSNHPMQHRMETDTQHTSALISIDFKNKTAETLNTIYTLED
jgi:hypothetical protein